MKGKAISVLLVGVCVLLATGCSEDEDSSSRKAQKSEKAATPEDVLKNLAKAMRDGDSKVIVACFDGTNDQDKVLIAMYKMASVMMKFEEAMVKQYGEDAVDKSGGKSALYELTDDKWLEGAETRINDGNATVTPKGGGYPINFVMMYGTWRICADDVLSAEQIQMKHLKKTLKMYEMMTSVVEDAMGKIGGKEYTAEKINQEIVESLERTTKEIFGDPTTLPFDN